MTRKVCIVTGTRAEYGLLSNLMREIKEDSMLCLQTVVTGMHLMEEYGLTYKVIEQDGFQIDQKVDMKQSGGTKVDVAKSVGTATIGFADCFTQLKPDLVVLLGDRYEILAAAQTAMILNIPIAHIHGGEVTEGAMDDSIRHAVTKMSHIHFTSTEEYRKRVIQLGENPENVFCVGAPGLDNIKKLDLLPKKELLENLNVEQRDKLFVVTYHPVTLEKDSPEKSVKNLFAALSQYTDASILITMPNSDPESDIIAKLIKEYAAANENVYFFTSLGQLRYLSALKHADAVIGNSSSGIIEAPFLKTPTVNIGIRQKGRIAADSVINCSDSEKEIAAAIDKSLSDEFKNEIADKKSLYGDGESSKRILEKIKSISLENICLKSFKDIKE